MMNAFLDLAERVFWTFAATFGGALLASPVFDSLGLDWQDSLKVALFAALGTSLKVIVAFSIDRQTGGQLLPGEGTVEVKPDTP